MVVLTLLRLLFRLKGQARVTDEEWNTALELYDEVTKDVQNEKREDRRLDFPWLPK